MIPEGAVACHSANPMVMNPGYEVYDHGTGALVGYVLPWVGGWNVWRITGPGIMKQIATNLPDAAAGVMEMAKYEGIV